MTLINRHIRKTVFLSMLVVLILTASINMVFSMAEELSDIGNDYTTTQVFIYVLRTLPTNIYELLPFSALGGALIGLGILASNNELVVIQSAGIPTWRIAWATMQPTLLIMILGLVVGEYVAPPLEQVAQSEKAVLQSGGEVVGGNQGTWQKIGSEFIYINAIAPGGESLYGVTRYRLNQTRQLVSTSFAESARYVSGGDQSYWELANVVETVIGTAQISTREYLLVDWPVDLSPELLSVLLVPPQRQSVSGLYRFSRYFENEGLEADSYFLAFWKKLLQPVSTGALVILAMSFVFGPLREATSGFRIFVAICAGLGFTIVQRLLEPASLIYGFSPLIAVLLPAMLCILLGMFMLRRVR